MHKYLTGILLKKKLQLPEKMQLDIELLLDGESFSPKINLASRTVKLLSITIDI